MDVNLTCMTTIDPDTGWFDIVQIPMFTIDDVMHRNDEYIIPQDFIDKYNFHVKTYGQVYFEIINIIYSLK